MENKSPEPPAPAVPLPAMRHDGWTGEKMAAFCEALAETAVVAEACEAARMGISGTYACRRRNPIFAAAWDAALSIARERLADTLLARSMEGNVEQIYKDGELVGERHLLDNRLGLAILRRLDRLAETGMTLSSRGERFVTLDRHPRPPVIRHPRPVDWSLALEAFRSGDDEAAAHALALVQGDEVEEVEDPSFSLSQGDAGVQEVDHWDRCWKDGTDDIWLTSFPPPPGFDGYQQCEWGDPDEIYERACTPEEAAILDANAAAERAIERAEEEATRDAWFALLKSEDLEHGSVERETATAGMAAAAS